MENEIFKEISLLEENEIEKLKAYLKIIKLNDKFNGDYEACLEIIKKVSNCKNNKAAAIIANFVERFWNFYSDKDLKEMDRFNLNIRIKEGVTLLSKFDSDEKSELANKVILDENNNLGEVCRYLYCISKLDNVNQIDTLDRIVSNENIIQNDLEILAMPLVMDADNNDLSNLNDLLDFSYEMDTENIEQNLRVLSKKKDMKKNK